MHKVLQFSIQFIILIIFLLSICIPCTSQNTTLNESLKTTIDSMSALDVASLMNSRNLRETYGMQSTEAKAQDSITHEIQASNLIVMDKILEKYGWLGDQEIGEESAYSFFAIIQHANENTRPKYLPIMREAVKNGICRAMYLARVEDRIATGKNELQIYGDQVKFYPETETFDVWPIIDPENVDQRRASIGLGPIATHLKNRFNLEWDLEKQKLRTKAFLEKRKLTKN